MSLYDLNYVVIRRDKAAAKLNDCKGDDYLSQLQEAKKDIALLNAALSQARADLADARNLTTKLNAEVRNAKEYLCAVKDMVRRIRVAPSADWVKKQLEKVLNKFEEGV